MTVRPARSRSRFVRAFVALALALSTVALVPSVAGAAASGGGGHGGGQGHGRSCDHQAVQSVLIIESKSKGNKDKNDVFNVVHTDEPSEANLRTCAELGHKA